MRGSMKNVMFETRNGGGVFGVIIFVICGAANV